MIGDPRASQVGQVFRVPRKKTKALFEVAGFSGAALFLTFTPSTQFREKESHVSESQDRVV